VTAVVLNYATPGLTWLAVRSLQTSLVRPGRILVVDNASPDGSADVLRQSLSDAEILSLPTNTGFAGGCNRGMAAALAGGAEFVLLVNSDAWVEAQTIGELLAAARVWPAGGIFAPVLVARDEPGRVTSAGIRYSELTARMRNARDGTSVDRLPSRPEVVDAVSGCVMLIRCDLVRRIGYLDERYFFAFEDIEYCRRARGAGFGVWCVPAARAHHAGSATIGGTSPRRLYFAARNHLLLASSSMRRAARPFRFAAIVALNGLHALRSRGAPGRRRLAAVWRGVRDHLAGRYGPDPFP
jgi:GT2 family glycosyltransferase